MHDHARGQSTGQFSASPTVGYASNLNAPKALGLMDRSLGLANGLSDLRGRLQAFSDRLSGSGIIAKGGEIQGIAPGLECSLSHAEGELRECLRLMDTLSDAF